MLRNWRKMLGAMAVVAGMTVPILTVSGASVKAAGGITSDCAGPATTAPGSLCIESSSNGSTTAPYVDTVLKGDRISTFTWLVNEDASTGDPSRSFESVVDSAQQTLGRPADLLFACLRQHDV